MNKTYWTGFLSGTTVLALGMTAILAGSGFQGANQKIGVVDSNDVIQKVAVAKNLIETEKNLRTDRETVVQFLDRYRIMKKEDADKFKTLTIKPNKTDADKAELEKIKAGAEDSLKKFKDLQLKSSPTADELKALDDFRNRQSEMSDYLQSLVNDFKQELQDIHDKNQNDLLEAFKAGLADVGKKQGYTLVMDKNVAPYGANDLTDEVSKAAAKK
ncbi:MAG: OmpH family outer membrane protein [Armatimonadetes bacterium]|nr:hypothetical protein [Armatimonadota bacterium]MBS1701132.1 OmpH family outer membrane protein [Armatimonadota bacterium]MBS1725139.1 OmpH family outer membrane protein [Armatimonadota bacterium]